MVDTPYSSEYDHVPYFIEPLLSYQKTGRRSVLATAPQIEHQQDQRQQAATDDIRFHGMKHAETVLMSLLIQDRLRQGKGMPECSFRIGPQVLEERPGHDQVVLEHNGFKGMTRCQTTEVSHPGSERR